MKKLVLTLGIIMAGLFTVNAQVDSPAEKQTEKLTTEYTKACSLTPDQVTKVKPLIEKFVEAKMADKKKYANDADGLKKADKAAKDALIADLKPILSAEQQQKMQAQMAEDQKKSTQTGTSANK